MPIFSGQGVTRGSTGHVLQPAMVIAAVPALARSLETVSVGCAPVESQYLAWPCTGQSVQCGVDAKLHLKSRLLAPSSVNKTTY